MNPEVPDKPSSSETILERLRRQQAETEASAAAALARIAKRTRVANDFDHLARIAVKVARTNRIKQHTANPTSFSDFQSDMDLIDSMVLVPDDQIPDAGKNELNFTSFVRSRIPEDRWSDFIEDQN